MDSSLVSIAVCFVAIFLAGVSSGLTSFGFALIATPLLLLLLPAKAVVPLVALHNTVSGLILLAQLRRWVDLRRIWLLTLAGVVGIPLGTYLLVTLEPGQLKVFIGLVTALSAVALLLGVRLTIRHEKLACGPVGLASGLLNGSTGMGGPPVILFFANQGMAKQAFRANLTAYFTAVNLLRLPGYVAGGIITPAIVGTSALYLPAMLLGLAAGARLAPRVDEPLFRRVTLVIVTLSALVALASGLGPR